ncbi:unnamed protein product [Lactuca saligna]|uniref:Uncharacterized protein n=1 Tax=Lactuca saligna TaxID=75948 RepID=A0AA35ZB97_LACSI|nr:unnamed protein product [Lactuca saligna]
MNSTEQNHAPTASSQDVGGSGSNQQNTDSVDQQDGTNINDTVFDEDGDEVVGSRRATRSPAWQHFIKFNLNGEVKARFLDPRYKLKFVELLLPVLYGEEKAKIEFQILEGFVTTLFQEFESSNASKKRKSEVPGSSSFGSSISSGHRVGFKKLLLNIASITRDDDESGATCSEETEAYCRSVEFDYDVEEENTKESGTTSLDDFV